MITLDVIGLMYSPAVLDDDGALLSGGEPLPGYHVNTIPAVEAWEAYRVTPTAKRRVFAGLVAETVCYKFPDEATYLSLLPEAGDATS